MNLRVFSPALLLSFSVSSSMAWMMPHGDYEKMFEEAEFVGIVKVIGIEDTGHAGSFEPVGENPDSSIFSFIELEPHLQKLTRAVEKINSDRDPSALDTRP